MIEEYTLFELCEKYNINSEKIVTKNNNILTYGEYVDIDNTLNYLINDLKITPNNIEKCPSILYRNVMNIKSNVEFLKKAGIHFSNIESCLHVLSTEPNDLKETYNYVITNYGSSAINKTTSILSVNKDIIISVENLNLPISKEGNLTIAVAIGWGSTTLEEIKKIIKSEEFNKYPHLFTSEVLTHAKLKEIQDIIKSEEFSKYSHLFTSTVLAHATLEEIQDIIKSEEFNKYPYLFTSEVLARTTLKEIQDIIKSEEFNKYPHLFTSEVLARTTLEEIQNIIKSDEFKRYPELFTSQVLVRAKLKEIQNIIKSDEFKRYPDLFTSTVLAHATLEEIQNIIKSDEFKKHPKLFTSQVLALAKLKDIQALLKMDYWQDEKFKNLLTSSVLANAKSMISKLPILINIAVKNGIDKYLNTSFLLFSPSQNYAIIQYLIDNNMSLIIDEKLNPIFGKQPGLLKKKYGVDIKELIVKYPLDLEEFKIDGGKKL